MSKHYHLRFGLAAAAIALSFLSVSPALSDSLPKRQHSKQLVEGLYTNDLEAATFFQQGVMRYNRSDFKTAELAFRKALQEDPFIPMARYLLGNALFQQGQIDSAAEQYRMAIGLDPNMTEAHYNLGLMLYQQGNIEEAISAYQQAIALDPNLAAARYNLGLALEAQGETEAALSEYTQAVRLNPNSAVAKYNLALLLAKENQTDSAIRGTTASPSQRFPIHTSPLPTRIAVSSTKPDY
jgi:tetratricopeptide (TPR) repeat protein